MAENVNDTWLSVSDISEKIGVPVETVRRYIRNHGVHLRVKKIHKKYEVHSDSLDVLKQIRELYADGKNIQEVEQTLSNRGVPMTITVQSDDDEPMNVSVADELKRMNDSFNEKFDKQSEQIKALAELVRQQQTYIDEKLDKRDEKLMKSLRSSLQKQIAAAQEEREESKKGFFARLFGGKK